MTTPPLWSFVISMLGLDIAYLCTQESPLPLTDPRDAEAQRMLNIPYRHHMVIKPFLVLSLAAEYRSRHSV